MELSYELLPNYFTLANNKNSHYKITTNTFDFVSIGSNTLVVTSGDSWSYGADLTPDVGVNTVTVGKDDVYRKENCYGNIISKKIRADWLNLSCQGCGNFWIANRISELHNIIDDLSYSKIYVICTFSEIGRGINTYEDLDVDYYQWFNNETLQVPEDFNKLLFHINNKVINKITAIAEKSKVVLRLGTNFTNPKFFESEYTLKIPWIGLLDETFDYQTAVCGNFGAEQIARIREFVPKAKLELYLLWINNLFDRAIDVNKKLTTSPVLYGRHPKTKGHEIWANYILENLPTL